ncbi:MAG: hypothetical protein L0Z62_14565, partial [Gemmataceae bacterium]|nr:hypothetical protein [Gemmataceae bacterium]
MAELPSTRRPQANSGLHDPCSRRDLCAGCTGRDAEVRLEVRQGTGRPSPYDLGDTFLIGTVAGCDLRVGGADLPALLCLVARLPGAVTVRKLAATVPVQVNGRPVVSATLVHGDRVTVGPVELVVHIEPAQDPAPPLTASAGPDLERETFRQQVLLFREEVTRFKQARERIQETQEQQRAEVEQRARALAEQSAELERDRALWHQRRAEIEEECRQREGDLPPAACGFASPPQEELAQRAADLEAQRQEVATARQELADIRRQLYDRYRERR